MIYCISQVSTRFVSLFVKSTESKKVCVVSEKWQLYDNIKIVRWREERWHSKSRNRKGRSRWNKTSPKCLILQHGERTELCYQNYLTCIVPKTNLTELTQPNFWNEIFGENEIFWLISPLCVQGTYYRAYASDCPKDLIMKSVKLSNWLQVLFFSFPGPGSIPSSSWSSRSSRLTSFSPPKIRYTFQ